MMTSLMTMKPFKDSLDAERGDVLVSSTGTVTYQKDHGTVYVRASIAGTDTKNPSTWQYVRATYGESLAVGRIDVPSSVVLAKGDTSKINATTTVTGVKEGTTTVSVTVAPTDTTAAITKDVVVVVTDKNSTVTPADEISRYFYNAGVVRYREEVYI